MTKQPKKVQPSGTITSQLPFLIISLGLAIAILSAIYSVYSVCASQCYSTNSAPLSHSTTLPTIARIKTSNPNSWKTYTNTQYGYAFSYPADAQITFVDSDSFMTGNTVKTIQIAKPRNSETDWQNWYSLNIFVEDNNLHLSAYDLIQHYLTELNKITETPPYDKTNQFITAKANSSLEPYHNGEITGMHALFGYESDFDLIVQVKNNHLYTFMYMGDNGQ